MKSIDAQEYEEKTHTENEPTICGTPKAPAETLRMSL